MVAAGAAPPPGRQAESRDTDDWIPPLTGAGAGAGDVANP